MQDISYALDNHYNTTPLQRGTASGIQAAHTPVTASTKETFRFPLTPHEKRMKKSQNIAESSRLASDPVSVRERAIKSATKNAAYNQFRNQPSPHYSLEQVAAMAQYSLQIGSMLQWERIQVAKKEAK